MKLYRALSGLLSYPGEALVAALPEIRSVAGGDAIAGLVEELHSESLLTLQERYVALFDRSRALSLHLFEHVHGESRERGQAMVDLQAMYESRGLRVVDHELPDYLPVFLEFLSLLPAAEAKGLLKETADILRAMGERLAARGSRYSEVFAALLALAGEPGLRRQASGGKVFAEDPRLLDRQWMDPEVTFGGPQPVHLYRKGIPA
jgi:nitrate reductase delta subunit